ncbi:MAG TPA: hypothetical protein VHD87_09550 [Acidimicrobiales bacterium]|nr:hypothetical protein [Acidimicrobiales bacterium]
MQTQTVKRALSKVPEVTLWFWVIKVLATTVGETAADYVNEHLGLGLTHTTYVSGVLLAVALVAQFRVRRYIPQIYWVAVVLISIFGTLITDNLTDGHNVPLTTSTPIFAVVLAISFAVWFAVERTLSIHSITSVRREAFYWLTILATFALGTAAGDLIGEKFNLGYPLSVVLFAGLIGVVAVAYYVFKVREVPAFWAAYILTRPLGASMGDLLSQSRHDGGLGLGTTVTTFLFLGAILAVVVYLARTHVDEDKSDFAPVA